MLSRPTTPAPMSPQLHVTQRSEVVTVDIHIDGSSTPNSISAQQAHLSQDILSSSAGVSQRQSVDIMTQFSDQGIKDINSVVSHSAKVPVTKPAYSLGHTDGAPEVKAVFPRKTGRIGLGHAFPTQEENDAYKAEKRALTSGPTSPGTQSPNHVGSHNSQPPSMDANTAEGRALLLHQLRQLIHEEFYKVHAEQPTQPQPPQAVQPAVVQPQQPNQHTTDNEIFGSEKAKSQDSGSHLTDCDDEKEKLDSLIINKDMELIPNRKESIQVNHVQIPVVEELEFPNPWAKFRYKMREPFAEFLGCFILMTFGNGINNQVVVSSLYDPSSPKGSYLSISFGWGIAVAMAVWVAGGVSGAMLNPAVTIALALFRKFPWKKVPIYIVAQVLGCFLGSLCIYGTYINPIRVVDPFKTEKTAGLFTTFPVEYLRQPSTRISSFWNEIYGTAILLIVILAIGDSSNTPPPDGMAPLVLLFLIVGLGATLGWQTAYCLNPARDLGPRLMLWVVGYPVDLLWTFDAWYWLWTPIIACILGAILGAFLYDALIYTGSESPLNAEWRFSDFSFRRSRKTLKNKLSSTTMTMDEP